MNHPDLTPCPEWCESTHDEPAPWHLWHRTRTATVPTLPGRPSFAVELAHALDDDTADPPTGPEISLHLWSGTPPAGLTISEARTLAAALALASARAEAAMPATCTRCAEPCHHYAPGLCFTCAHLVPPRT